MKKALSIIYTQTGWFAVRLPTLSLRKPDWTCLFGTIFEI